MRVRLRLSVVLLLAPCAAWPQGDPVGPEFRVNTYTTYGQRYPSLAVDASGNFVVVWESGLQYYRQVIGQRYSSAGTPVGLPFPVSTLPDHNAAPTVAADPAGNFLVVWEWWPFEPAGVRGQRYASSGEKLGNIFSVSTSSYSYAPSVTAGSAENFVVVWESPVSGDGSGRGVFGRRIAGGALGPVFRVNTYTTGDQSGSSVAADSAGNFVVGWRSANQDGSSGGIFAQRFAGSGAPQGSEFRVNSDTTYNQGAPSLTADSAGNFVVTWESADGSGDGIFGQRYAGSGAPLGGQFRVSTVTTDGQGHSAVTADASGNFVVVWRSSGQDGSAYGVFGQRYDSSGTPLGPEFRVNAYTTGDQGEPSIATDPLGKFVVVWESFNQDGSAEGVYGQRYGMIVPVELMRFRVE